MAGTASATLNSILLDRNEPCLKLQHGVRIPINATIMQVVASYRGDSVRADQTCIGDDDNPGRDSPFPVFALLPGGFGCISSSCYLLRVSFPAEFHVLCTYEYLIASHPEYGDSMGGWWREDTLVPKDEIVPLCSDYAAKVLDGTLRVAVEEYEANLWSQQPGEDQELRKEPDGLAIRFRGRIARFDSDERVHCRFLFAMLTSFIKDPTLPVPVADLRSQVGSQAKNQRWAYNICKIANQRATPLDLGYELRCPKGAETVTWERLASDVPILKAA
jgi:hypothetical protein